MTAHSRDQLSFSRGAVYATLAIFLALVATRTAYELVRRLVLRRNQTHEP